MSDECCARTRLECENECDEYVKQLKQQIEELNADLCVKDVLLGHKSKQLSEAVEVIEFYKNEFEYKYHPFREDAEADMKGNIWYGKRARQFLAKHRGEK